MDKCPARVEHDLDGADDVSWIENRGVKFGVVVYRISTWQSKDASVP